MEVYTKRCRANLFRFKQVQILWLDVLQFWKDNAMRVLQFIPQGSLILEYAAGEMMLLTCEPSILTELQPRERSATPRTRVSNF